MFPLRPLWFGCRLNSPPPWRRQLAQWCSETAGLLDVPAVAGADIIEALIDQLVDDSHTSDAVRRRLVESGSYRAPAPLATIGQAPARAVDGDRISQALAQRLNQCPRTIPVVAVTRIDNYLRAMDRAARPSTVEGTASSKAVGA
jgi:hypothetical protein